MKLKTLGILCFSIVLFSCGEYSKVLKNPDMMVRYEYAKKYFEEGKYNRSSELLEDIVRMTRGSSMGEECMYLLAQSYYRLKDYPTASSYFKTYYNTYPQGEYAEIARYYAAQSLYLESPDARFDQTDTYAAMKAYQEFLEMYPQSEWAEASRNALIEMQEKLALKELYAIRLYYNLGDYNIVPFPGGNYTSCVITARNAIQSYPYSMYREDFMYYTFKSKYEMAIQSIEEKKDIRYRDVIDEYHSYVNEFSNGKYTAEVKRLYDNVMKEMNKN